MGFSELLFLLSMKIECDTLIIFQFREISGLFYLIWRHIGSHISVEILIYFQALSKITDTYKYP